MFQDAVTASGKTVEDLGAEGALEQMAVFYQKVRAENCVLNEEGDTLLYEWGTHEEEAVPGFRLEFTRHFIEPGNEDEDGMSQLSLTLYYSPAPALKTLKPEIHLCSTLEGAAEFEKAVRSSDAFQAAAKLKPLKTVLAWYEV